MIENYHEFVIDVETNIFYYTFSYYVQQLISIRPRILEPVNYTRDLLNVINDIYIMCIYNNIQLKYEILFEYGIEKFH